MEEVLTEAHLAIEVDVGGLSSLFQYDADAANTCRSCLAFDGCALFCATQHHLSFISRVRLGVLCEAPPSPVVRILRSMDVLAATTSRVSVVCVLRSMGAGYPSAYHLCLVFDGCVLWQPTPPPIVCVS